MLSTSEFASAVGLSESTVRRLADSGELEIHRTRGGHRRIPVPEAIRYVRETRARIVRPDLLGLVDRADSIPKRADSKRLLEALREGHADAVIGLIQAMYAAGTSIAEICDVAIRDAMRIIGDAWPHDKRAIFIEHRATLLCVRALCQIRLSIPDPDEDAPTAMGAAPQDDPYLLPSLMVSVVLHDCGYDETNLGPNTPIDVLADSVADERPDLVWLAITEPIRRGTQSRQIDRLAEVVDEYGGSLVIGGANSPSYENHRVLRCRSMVELKRLAIQTAEH
jgi:excisionase family DNA binding protein